MALKVYKPAALFLPLGLAAFAAATAHAESGGDLAPTGVSTEAIQLPKPAGTIQGFGGEASSVGNTGAATYSVPIELPKGRNGLQPSLSLTYNSSAGQGPFGFGWSLDVPMVERSTLRGVPQYTNADLISSSADGELVNLGQESYRPLIDKSQSLYQYDPATDQWVRYAGDGLVDHFGASTDSKVTTGSGTFKWLAASTVDPFGNTVSYTYLHDAGQTYVSQIAYAGLYTVQFGYETRPDALKSYMSTDGITTRLRCNDIWVRAKQLIRHYHLVYDLTPNGHLSRLRVVQLFGTDDVTKYPDLSFTFSEEAALTTQQSKAVTFDTTGAKALPPSLVNPRVNLIDLNSDGLTDVLESREDGAVVWLGNGDGKFKASYQLPGMVGVLGTKNTKLVDVDGDRHVDFVGSGLYPKYWPGDGKGGFGAAKDITSFPRYSVGSTQVKTIDVNGDGKMDLVAQEADEIWTYFNGGNGRWDRRVKMHYRDPGTPYPVFNFSSPHTFMADMNGDGLADIVYVDTTRIFYYPNRGNGYWDAPVTMTFEGPSPATILSYAQKERNILLMDINGDGLSDLVVVLPDSILYAYSRGDGTFSQTYTYNNVHATPPDPTGIYITSADMDGNGTQDLVWTNDFGDVRYFDFNETVKPNLLVQIKNGLGKETDLQYTPHTKYGASPLLSADEQNQVPYAIHTVSDIKTYAWGTLTNETQFSYYGGYYDGVTNEFRGFRLIERYEPGDDSVPDLLDRRFFEVGDTNVHDKERGLMTRQELRTVSISRGAPHWRLTTEGPILKGEQTQYQTLLIGTGVYGTDAGMALEALKTAIEGDEAGGLRTYDTATSYTLSQGAILSKVSLTKDDHGNPYRLIVDTFAQGIQLDGTSAALWNVTNLAERDIEDPNAGNALLQSTRFYFDNQQQLGAVTQGKITRQDKLQSGVFVTKNTYSWTADGNLATFADASGHTTRIDYEPTYRLFPSQVTNPKGQVQSAFYDWGRGVITMSEDVNANFTLYAYDPFLRLSRVQGPAKDFTTLDPAHPTLGVTYTFGDDTGTPGTILTQKLTDIGETTTIDSKAYFDPLGRSLGTVLSGPPGKFVHTGGAEYNIRGKVKKKYLPFFVNSLDDSALNTTRPFIATTFDILDRPLTVANPESTPTNPSVKVMQYKVGETDTTDEIGKLTKDFYDFLGRLTGVTNALGRSTSYGYTLTNQLDLILDAKLETTLFQYDSLDRRTCKLDPNLGQTRYSYNDLDLLTQKLDYGWVAGITGCGQTPNVTPRTTAYQYNDPLNRVTQVDYGDATAGPVGYSYDAGLNGIGKLTGTTFPAGSKSLGYDIYGNVSQTTLTVGGTSYGFTEKYDVLGRLREVDYPAVGGAVLRVGDTYDAAGNLSAVTDLTSGLQYASNLQYNELNQIASLDFGNGLHTRMSYDVGQGSYRLTDILTYAGAVVGSGVPIQTACQQTSGIQCLAYSYNKTSDVTQIQDLTSGASAPNRLFQYDDLHELTAANGGPWGNQGFSYDEIGNLTVKTSTTAGTQGYTYAPARPQILTSFGGTAYGFDPFGNLSQIGTKETYTFNNANQLASYLKNSISETYRYDEIGQRVTKSGKNAATFVGRYYEDQDGHLERYVFAGSRRIAIVPENGNNVRYLHPDHLGSSNLLTDHNGGVVDHREYAPYGELASETGGFNQLKYGFTDKYEDPETGIDYFGARYLLPGVGRWASADPLFQGTVFLSNRNATQMDDLLASREAFAFWSYVLNSPVKFHDADGKESDIERYVIFTPQANLLKTGPGPSYDLERSSFLPSPTTIAKANDLATILNRNLEASGGGRTVERNIQVHGAPGSFHLEKNGNLAIDIITPSGLTKEEFGKTGEKAGFTGILTKYEGNDRHVHFDQRGTPYSDIPGFTPKSAFGRLGAERSIESSTKSKDSQMLEPSSTQPQDLDSNPVPNQ